jgi:hypothetical protein
LTQIADNIDIARIMRHLAERDAVLGEQIALRQTKLDRVVAEQVGDHGVDPGLLPSHYVAPLRGAKPGIEARD